MRKNCHLSLSAQQHSANKTLCSGPPAKRCEGLLWRHHRNWNFGITWIWIQLAISTVCRDLPAEILAALCIFSFNQFWFSSESGKGVHQDFSGALPLSTHRYTHIEMYIFISLSLSAELLLYNPQLDLSTGMAILSYWPPHLIKTKKSTLTYKQLNKQHNCWESCFCTL